MVFTPAELRDLVDDAERLAAGHPGRHYVSLLKSAPTAAAARRFEARSTDAERAHVVGRAVHLLLGENYHRRP